MKQSAVVRSSMHKPPGCPPQDDLSLMKRVAAADRAAFELLYHKYVHRLRAFLERMTRRSSLVEEVLNDTMLAVWCKAGTYDEMAKPSTWIFGIAYRKGLKALHRADKASAFGITANEDSFRSEPDSMLQRTELREYLSRALTALSVNHRTVLRLVYYKGYACREIADMMDCPIDTVKTRVFYARRKLRASLAQIRPDSL